MDQFVLGAAVLTVVVATGLFLLEGELGWGFAALWALQCAVLKFTSDE